MAYTAYATYFIFFQDITEYNFALVAVGGSPTTGGHINLSPAGAAALFGIPNPYPTGNVISIPRGIQFMYPYIPGLEILHPNASGIFLDDTVNSMTVPQQTVGGVITPEMNLVWDGQIVFNGTNDGTGSRRFINGFENNAGAEGATLTETRNSRDSSRTIEGYGSPIRGAAGVSRIQHNINQYTGVTPDGSWERFYVRVRTLGSATVMIWRAHSTAGAFPGIALNVTSGGNLQAVSIDAADVQTQLGILVTGLEINRWYRIDVTFDFTARTSLWMVNGFIIMNPGLPLGVAGDHNQSEMGKCSNAASTAFECDVDDWVNMDPAVFVFGLNSMGSHVRRQFIESGTTVNWTPLNIQIANQMHSPGDQVSSQLSSAIAAAEIVGATDVLPPDVDFADASGMVAGPRAAVINSYSNFPIGQTAQLGYSEAGGAYVNQNIAGGAILTSYSRLFPLSAGYDISPFGIKYIHHGAATNAQVNGLGANAEYVGVWGPEDFANFVARPRLTNIHNCQYWNTAYAMPGAPPDGPIIVISGTYAGNGLSQTIALPGPAHMIVIRNATSAIGPIIWFATGLGGGNNVTQLVVPNYIMRVWFDPLTGTYNFTISGSGNVINQVGQTYNVVAYCDPGARLNLCGAYNHEATIASYDNVLCDSGFTAEFAFLQHQTPGQGVGTVGLSCKGPGNSGLTGRFLDGTAAANWGSFSAGILNTRADSHFTDNYQVAYSLFRTSDALGQVFVQITSYTGNGAGGTRNIPLTPVSGNSPCLVIVVPATAAPAIIRDLSHTGSNSCLITNGTNTATGITALSVDQITVGVTLNANAVVYNVFALIAGRGSGLPSGTEWPNPTLVPPEVAVIGDGGLQLGTAIPLTLLKDVSGIYTLVPGKTNDTLYDRQTGQDSVDVKIPDPTAKTGFIGG